MTPRTDPESIMRKRIGVLEGRVNELAKEQGRQSQVNGELLAALHRSEQRIVAMGAELYEAFGAMKPVVRFARRMMKESPPGPHVSETEGAPGSEAPATSSSERGAAPEPPVQQAGTGGSQPQP